MDINARHLNILVIEDNPGDARLIIEFLAPQASNHPSGTYLLESVDGRLRNVFNGEFTVTVAERLESGINLLDEEPFDAVLLDLTLPDSDGLATFERLHSHAPTVPVIVLTGMDNDYFGIAAAQKGAQDYLIKGDIDRSALVRAIRYAIERAQLESRILQTNQSLEERVKLRTEELDTARERASRSEKMAIIGQLSGGIAHDLRNPLHVISHAAELVIRKINAEPVIENRAMIKEFLEIIDSEVTQASAVITNLLSHGSTKKLTFANLQIGDVIQDSFNSFVLNDNIVLSMTIDPDLSPISGDASQLARVLQNLALNAQDAMETGGLLSITAHQTNGFVEIVVADTGNGIDPENIDRIFEPLFSDKSHGTGLGLAICREIMDKHDGEIFVTSKIGTGTSLTLQIPIANRENSSLAA